MMPEETAHRVAVFATLFVLFYIGHLIADHWGQRSTDAMHKQDPGARGAAHCLIHVAMVLGVKVAVLGAGLVALGLRIPLGPAVVAMLAMGVSHYLVDRGAPLHRMARALGQTGYITRVGVVRAPDQAPVITGPGTAAFHLDQSWHVLWLGIGAGIIAAAL